MRVARHALYIDVDCNGYVSGNISVFNANGDCIVNCANQLILLTEEMVDVKATVQQNSSGKLKCMLILEATCSLKMLYKVVSL